MGPEQRAETVTSLATTSRRHVSEPPASGRDAEVGTVTSQVAAFQRLADEHIEQAYRLANAILRNPSDAEDAVHDAFVTAWSHWSSLRDEGRFEAWFGRIVVNTCRDRLRQVTRWRLTDISDEVGLSTADASSAIHDREQVAVALGRLRPDDRIVLALRYYRDLKVDEIAGLLGIPPGTATSRLRSAHERLQIVLDDTSRGEATR